MPFDDDAPGYKARRNKDGTVRHVWVARADLVRKGYTPKTVRLHYDATTPDGRALIAAACRRYQAEMLSWAAGQKQDYLRFDGTLRSLIRLYQTDPASPYKAVKWNTRRNDYDPSLAILERAFGKRSLSALRHPDFRRWYDEAKKPATPGGPERVRRAHGLIKMLRLLMSYGIMTELPECARLKSILDEARFKQPARRRVRLELKHVRSFITAALEAGRLSLALGTALQFETGMRQRDVIGEWEPIPDGGSASGVVLRRRRWVNGLTWSDIGDDLVLRKATTKTGSLIAVDLALCPLVTELLEQIPAEQRVGALIVDEMAGRPYAEWAYGREWRVVARAAGIPDTVWNMDARAGAITEAEDAGAALDEIRGAVGHAQASTTARYSRGALGKARRIAELRAAHRKARNDE
ncbi:integrase [Microbaculum marinisediminis]|uniref:Integrase n=1 Tax=Microbaculum marinisediminis TaxID=2931392 RepID=A0AAW5QT82_9HYPH|nr:integrase [Microbaculum sp. A6E488]MCT8970689.1 integrase [Microbaculum sp. A6E488]